MPEESSDTLLYKRCKFITYLPKAYLYSHSHFWLAQEGPDLWRIGFTKFATRMLGEIVEQSFETKPDSDVFPGEVIGWVEGFKALTEIFCVASGKFLSSNPALENDCSVISRDPYGEGWLYRIQGEPDTTCVDVNGYWTLLDDTIGAILENDPTP